MFTSAYLPGRDLTYSSMQDMLSLTAETYRRAIWDNQSTYVEIWLEKDALAGVVYEETDPWTCR